MDAVKRANADGSHSTDLQDQYMVLAGIAVVGGKLLELYWQTKGSWVSSQTH